MEYASIGVRVKERRKALGISASDLALKLSLSKATIHRYENGDIRNIKMPVVESMARELKVSPLWLIGKSEQMETGESIESDFSLMLDELIDHACKSLCLIVNGREVTKEQRRTIITGLELTKKYMDSIK